MIRTFDEVRIAKDERLGRDAGMSLGDAWALLTGPERVAWILGELSYLTNERRFHVWIQGYAEGDFEGPQYVAALAEAGESLDPGAAAIFRWIAERGQLVRDGKRGEALFSVVPYVWGPMHDRCIDWMKGVVERWPADVDPGDLPKAAALQRTIQAPVQAGSCRYPGALFVLSEAAGPGLDALLEHAAHSLWLHGVSNDDLDEIFAWAPSDVLEFVEGLSELMSVTATPEELEALRASAPTLTELLGVDGIPGTGVLRVPRTSLDSSFERTAPFANCKVLGRSPEVTLVAELRSAPRMGLDVIFVDTASGVPEDAAQMITNLGLTGFIVVLGEG